MPSLASPAFFLFQEAPASVSDVHLIMIFTGIIAICILVVLVALVLGALIAYVKIRGAVTAAEKKAQPLILQGQNIAGHVNEIIADLKPKIASISSTVTKTVTDVQPKVASISTAVTETVADIKPKVASVTSDIERISAMVRGKAEEAGTTFSKMNETVQDVNQKSKQQVERVNGMVSDALTTTEHVSKQIQHGIKVPVQKIAEWVAAAKVGIEHLSERIPFLHHEPTTTRSAGPRPTGSAAPGGPPFVPAPTRIRE